MGSCTRRHFLLSTCFLQLITIIERQVFDFLGYMWAPILANFFHIIFVIFGFYGAYHFRAKYIVTYLIWNFIWIGWNAFLICFYLNVGLLDRNSDILNLGTGSVSWFEVNGYGCKPTYPTNITSEDPYRPVRPESVDDCLLEYPVVEIVHSGVQCILAVLAIIGAMCIGYIFLDEDDRFDFMGGDAKSPQHTVVHPMYVSYTSIPTSASATMLSKNHNNINNAKQSFHSDHTIISNQYYDDKTATADRVYNNHNSNNKTRKPSNSSSVGSLQKLSNSVNSFNNALNDNNCSNSNRLPKCQSKTKTSSYSSFISNPNHPRPDIKYTQMSTEQLVATNANSNFDEYNEDMCLQTFRNNAPVGTSCVYVPFQNAESAHPTPVRDNSQFLLNGNGFGDGYENYAYSQPINSIPSPFIRQCQRSGNQPYPDLSPEVTEKYAMPHQFIPRSPMPNRSSSRRRHDRSQVANFCDQIRNAPPGYNNDVTFNMARAKSQDRLSSNRSNGNRRSSNSSRNHKPRPRSYCNATAGVTTDSLPSTAPFSEGKFY